MNLTRAASVIICQANENLVKKKGASWRGFYFEMKPVSSPSPPSSLLHHL